MNRKKVILSIFLFFDIMNFLNYFCHRIPERSFFFRGHQFPVCARCTGLYLGIAISLILNYLLIIRLNTPIIIVGLILILPTAIDGITQLYEYRESNNYLRLITGIFGGIGIGLLIIEINEILFYLIN